VIRVRSRTNKNVVKLAVFVKVLELMEKSRRASISGLRLTPVTSFGRFLRIGVAFQRSFLTGRQSARIPKDSVGKGSLVAADRLVRGMTGLPVFYLAIPSVNLMRAREVMQLSKRT